VIGRSAPGRAAGFESDAGFESAADPAAAAVAAAAERDVARRMHAASAAPRILDALLSMGAPGIEGRAERAALLPECFSPPSEGVDGFESDDGFESRGGPGGAPPETEELWTTPGALLAAADAAIKARSGCESGDTDSDAADLNAALRALREDVAGFTAWGGGQGGGGGLNKD